MIQAIKNYFFSRKEDRKIEESDDALIRQYLSLYKNPQELLQEAEKLKILVKKNERKNKKKLIEMKRKKAIYFQMIKIKII